MIDNNYQIDVQKRVAIYARVSTAEQAEEGFSIEGQLRVINDYCKAMGKTVMREYVDKGVSGKSMKGRLQLQQLLDDAERGLFDEVIVWKISRMARNQLDLMKIVDKLNKNNISFRSYSENFETETPMGKFALQMMGAVGELERNTIVENVKMGMKQRARTGKWNGGIVIGYRSVEIPDTGKKNKTTKLEIVPEEAAIVRYIFELYSTGKGLKAITNQINHEGHLTKKGNMFTTGGVKDILMNPIYIGKIRYNLRENWGEKRRKGINKNPIIEDGEHEAIIPIELWDKVQEMYAKKSQKPKRTFDSQYLLTGLIKCPVCGASMVAGRTKNKLKDGSYRIIRYYVCGNWRSKGTAACNSNGIRADKAEEYVISRVKEVVTQEKVLKAVVANMNEEKDDRKKPLERELNGIKIALKEMEIKKNRLFELFEEGIIAKESLSQRINAYSSDMEVLDNRKSEIEEELSINNSKKIPYIAVKKILMNFNKMLGNSTTERKKTLLQLVINKITVRDRKKINGIELDFDEKVQKYFINNKEGESSDDGDSPSIFSIKI